MNYENIPYSLVSVNGQPTHVMIPLEEYLTVFGMPDAPPGGDIYIPSDVATKVMDDISPLLAWREHFRLTQADVAERMAVSRPAYAQMEKSTIPHLSTLEKAATAFGIKLPQLSSLYDLYHAADNARSMSPDATFADFSMIFSKRKLSTSLAASAQKNLLDDNEKSRPHFYDRTL